MQGFSFHLDDRQETGDLQVLHEPFNVILTKKKQR